MKLRQVIDTQYQYPIEARSIVEQVFLPPQHGRHLLRHLY